MKANGCATSASEHLDALAKSVDVNELQAADAFFVEQLAPLLGTDASDIDAKALARVHGSTVTRLLKTLGARLTTGVATDVASMLASTSCSALDALDALKPAIKASGHDLEVQRYGFIRKFLVLGLHARAHRVGCDLFKAVSSVDLGQSKVTDDLRVGVALNIIVCVAELTHGRKDVEEPLQLFESTLAPVQLLIAGCKQGSCQHKQMEHVYKYMYKCTVAAFTLLLEMGVPGEHDDASRQQQVLAQVLQAFCQVALCANQEDTISQVSSTALFKCTALACTGRARDTLDAEAKPLAPVFDGIFMALVQPVLQRGLGAECISCLGRILEEAKPDSSYVDSPTLLVGLTALIVGTFGPGKDVAEHIAQVHTFGEEQLQFLTQSTLAELDERKYSLEQTSIAELDERKYSLEQSTIAELDESKYSLEQGAVRRYMRLWQALNGLRRVVSEVTNKGALQLGCQTLIVGNTMCLMSRLAYVLLENAHAHAHAHASACVVIDEGEEDHHPPIPELYPSCSAAVISVKLVSHLLLSPPDSDPPGVRQELVQSISRGLSMLLSLLKIPDLSAANKLDADELQWIAACVNNLGADLLKAGAEDVRAAGLAAMHIAAEASLMKLRAASLEGGDHDSLSALVKLHVRSRLKSSELPHQPLASKAGIVSSPPQPRGSAVASTKGRTSAPSACTASTTSTANRSTASTTCTAPTSTTNRSSRGIRKVAAGQVLKKCRSTRQQGLQTAMSAMAPGGPACPPDHKAVLDIASHAGVVRQPCLTQAVIRAWQKGTADGVQAGSLCKIAVMELAVLGEEAAKAEKAAKGAEDAKLGEGPGEQGVAATATAAMDAILDELLNALPSSHHIGPRAHALLLKSMYSPALSETEALRQEAVDLVHGQMLQLQSDSSRDDGCGRDQVLSQEGEELATLSALCYTSLAACQAQQALYAGDQTATQMRSFSPGDLYFIKVAVQDLALLAVMAHIQSATSRQSALACIIDSVLQSLGPAASSLSTTLRSVVAFVQSLRGSSLLQWSLEPQLVLPLRGAALKVAALGQGPDWGAEAHSLMEAAATAMRTLQLPYATATTGTTATAPRPLKLPTATATTATTTNALPPACTSCGSPASSKGLEALAVQLQKAGIPSAAERKAPGVTLHLIRAQVHHAAAQSLLQRGDAIAGLLQAQESQYIASLLQAATAFEACSCAEDALSLLKECSRLALSIGAWTMAAAAEFHLSVVFAKKLAPTERSWGHLRRGQQLVLTYIQSIEGEADFHPRGSGPAKSSLGSFREASRGSGPAESSQGSYREAAIRVYFHSTAALIQADLLCSWGTSPADINSDDSVCTAFYLRTRFSSAGKQQEKPPSSCCLPVSKSKAMGQIDGHTAEAEQKLPRTALPWRMTSMWLTFQTRRADCFREGGDLAEASQVAGTAEARARAIHGAAQAQASHSNSQLCWPVEHAASHANSQLCCPVEHAASHADSQLCWPVEHAALLLLGAELEREAAEQSSGSQARRNAVINLEEGPQCHGAKQASMVRGSRESPHNECGEQSGRVRGSKEGRRRGRGKQADEAAEISSSDTAGCRDPHPGAGVRQEVVLAGLDWCPVVDEGAGAALLLSGLSLAEGGRCTSIDHEDGGERERGGGDEDRKGGRTAGKRVVGRTKAASGACGDGGREAHATGRGGSRGRGKAPLPSDEAPLSGKAGGRRRGGQTDAQQVDQDGDASEAGSEGGAQREGEHPADDYFSSVCLKLLKALWQAWRVPSLSKKVCTQLAELGFQRGRCPHLVAMFAHLSLGTYMSQQYLMGCALRSSGRSTTDPGPSAPSTSEPGHSAPPGDSTTADGSDGDCCGMATEGRGGRGGKGARAKGNSQAGGSSQATHGCGVRAQAGGGNQAGSRQVDALVAGSGGSSDDHEGDRLVGSAEQQEQQAAKVLESALGVVEGVLNKHGNMRGNLAHAAVSQAGRLVDQHQPSVMSLLNELAATWLDSMLSWLPDHCTVGIISPCSDSGGLIVGRLMCGRPPLIAMVPPPCNLNLECRVDSSTGCTTSRTDPSSSSAAGETSGTSASSCAGMLAQLASILESSAETTGGVDGGLGRRASASKAEPTTSTASTASSRARRNGSNMSSSASTTSAEAEEKAAKLRWWQARVDLDQRMSGLLQDMAKSYLGPWRLLLTPIGLSENAWGGYRSVASAVVSKVQGSEIADDGEGDEESSGRGPSSSAGSAQGGHGVLHELIALILAASPRRLHEDGELEALATSLCASSLLGCSPEALAQAMLEADIPPEVLAVRSGGRPVGAPHPVAGPDISDLPGLMQGLQVEGGDDGEGTGQGSQPGPGSQIERQGSTAPPRGQATSSRASASRSAANGGPGTGRKRASRLVALAGPKAGDGNSGMGAESKAKASEPTSSSTSDTPALNQSPEPTTSAGGPKASRGRSTRNEVSAREAAGAKRQGRSAARADEADLENEGSGSHEEACSTAACRPCLLLVLEEKLQALPWESTPCLRGHEVYRTPSLPLACASAAALQIGAGPASYAGPGSNSAPPDARQSSPQIIPQGDTRAEGGSPDQAGRRRAHSAAVVDPTSAYYLINPEGDLITTQKAFEPWVSEQLGWEGTAGSSMPEKDILSALQSHSMFTYLGHGSGEQYVSVPSMRRLQGCATNLLMGCSSGRLRDSGQYGVTGAVAGYMLAGCPAVVANLWDVTDGDIDRFCTSLLSQWLTAAKEGTKGGSGAGTSTEASSDGQAANSRLGQVVANSRSACRLQFLIGSAPVCFGLPVAIKRA
eukprot:gene1706-33112_t